MGFTSKPRSRSSARAVDYAEKWPYYETHRLAKPWEGPDYFDAKIVPKVTEIARSNDPTGQSNVPPCYETPRLAKPWAGPGDYDIAGKVTEPRAVVHTCKDPTNMPPKVTEISRGQHVPTSNDPTNVPFYRDIPDKVTEPRAVVRTHDDPTKIPMKVTEIARAQHVHTPVDPANVPLKVTELDQIIIISPLDTPDICDKIGEKDRLKYIPVEKGCTGKIGENNRIKLVHVDDSYKITRKIGENHRLKLSHVDERDDVTGKIGQENRVKYTPVDARYDITGKVGHPDCWRNV